MGAEVYGCDEVILVSVYPPNMNGRRYLKGREMGRDRGGTMKNRVIFMKKK
jgi:hypothetical protein